jgi:hypothetical protein
MPNSNTDSESHRGRRWTDYVPLETVQRAPRNPKGHNSELIANSISRFGIVESPAIDERTGRLVAGHGRLDDWITRKAAGEAPPDGIDIDPETGDWLVPVQRGWASRSDADAEAYLVISNSSSQMGGWDDEALAQLLADLRDQDETLLDLTGFDGDFISAHWDGDSNPWDHSEPTGTDDDTTPGPNLFDRFLIPPFDTLDARQGTWQDRKRRWLALDMGSEIGRGQNLAFADISSSDPDYYRQKADAESVAGRPLTHAEFQAQAYPEGVTGRNTGTSIFDPVLCELTYRWFTAPGGHVLDPFAGGSVRGVAAAILGRHYTGVDLRPEQVDANRATAARLLTADGAPMPTWMVGDSADVVPTLPPASFDLMFTCPPYYDLEAYSDDPHDLSSMSYDGFDEVYTAILAAGVRALRPDRFAVIVTGDARDSRGILHDLRGSTIRAMEAAGCGLVTAGVLITPVGSAAMRAGRQFTATRTLARCHQDVLVFCKGDRKRATQWCGDVDVSLPDALDTDDSDMGTNT